MTWSTPGGRRRCDARLDGHGSLTTSHALRPASATPSARRLYFGESTEDSHVLPAEKAHSDHESPTWHLADVVQPIRQRLRQPHFGDPPIKRVHGTLVRLHVVVLATGMNARDVSARDRRAVEWEKIDVRGGTRLVGGGVGHDEEPDGGGVCDEGAAEDRLDVAIDRGEARRRDVVGEKFDGLLRARIQSTTHVRDPRV